MSDKADNLSVGDHSAGQKRKYRNLMNNPEANTKQTENAKDAAVRIHCEPFLESKGLSRFALLTDKELCNPKLFGELGDYLVTKEREPLCTFSSLY